VGVNVGHFINAVIAFVIVAVVLYFFVVVPYTKAKERYFPTSEPEGTPEDIALLREIRDALVSRPDLT
jgi:large conductance mechanosensitive channel